MKKIICMLLLIQGGFMMAQETVVTATGKKIQINPFANNGLSAVGGFTQLGGDLMKDTYIDLKGFSFGIKGLPTGSLTDNIVVVDPATGNLKMVASSGSGNFWSLTGNAGTNPALNFLGTTDDNPLKFRIHDTNAGTLSKTATAFGYNALNPVSTGGSNTAFGLSTLSANTSGWANTAIGATALSKNTTGGSNVAVGSDVLSANVGGSSNTAVGSLSMQLNTSGGSNTAVGSASLNQNTSGNWNTALGAGAVQANKAGVSNTGVGYFAMYNNTDGKQNTSLGDNALRINQIGNNNTSIGFQSGRNIQGNNNVTLGSGVLGQTSVTDNVPYTGDLNIAIGYNLSLSSRSAANEMNIGNALFGIGINGSTIGTAKIGVNTNAPTTALHVKPNVAGADPIRVEGLNTGSSTDKMVVADVNGLLKTVNQPTSTMSVYRTTVSYTATGSDNVILVDAGTTATVDITLPAAPTVGKVYTVKRVDTTAGTVNIKFATGTAKVDETDSTIAVGGKVTYQIIYAGIVAGVENWQTISRF